ncbi:hypothetical protein C8F01DRAFT_1134103 [Mycena amicta]|nr:hypothetical protein C8F01DRAFT_1134103 [Mycena amicta]
MLLNLTGISPINTVLSDESGNPQYKVSTPKAGGTTYVSCVIQIQNPVDNNSFKIKSEDTGMRFANLALIDFHEHHYKLSSTITFRGEERKVNEWLRKQGAGKGWFGPHRPFTGEDGNEYKWLLKSNHCELRTNDAAETLVACYHPRKDRLFSRGKKPAALEIIDAYEAMRDEIVVTFVFLEQLRGEGDRGEIPPS